MRWSLATIVFVPRGGAEYASQRQRQQVFDWAASAGFAGIELSPRWLAIDGMAAPELAAVRREAADCGLAISGININRCILTRVPEADGHRTRIERAIRAATVLEAPVVTVSLSLPLTAAPRPPLRGSDVPEPEREETATRLIELASLARFEGVQLSLELHDDGLLDTPELCLDMLRRIGRADVGVNPDLGNLARSTAGQSLWLEALKLLAPYTNNWHVKNYRGGQPAPLWNGDIDYAQAAPLMLASGYRGWVSIESYFGDVRELQTRSLAYLNQLRTAFDEASPAEQGSAA